MKIQIEWQPITGVALHDAHDIDLDIQASVLRVLRDICNRQQIPFAYADLRAETITELNRRMDLDGIPF